MTSTDQIPQVRSHPQSGRRIVLLTASLALGGAEVVVVELAKYLQKRGWCPSVVTMLSPEAFEEDLLASGIEVVSLDMRPGRLGWRPFFKLRNYLRQTRPDLVHAHMFHASILGRLMRVAGGPPVICTVHNTIEGSQRTGRTGSREWIFRLTNGACQRTTGVSRRVKSRYVTESIVPEDRIEVVPNGVDTRKYSPAPERIREMRARLGWGAEFVWLAVGRLVKAKDYPNLIEAFRRVNLRFPSARLAIAGDGQLHDQIRNLVERANLSHAVSLLGSRTDVPDLMRACDALVVASAWEGGPLVLAEAGASGKPAVSTLVGAADEIVLQGKTGFLVPPRDSAALEEAMVSLMALDKAVLAAMGANARARVIEAFSIDLVNQKYVDVYERVLFEAG
jgi:glycosyltransferase involved in cell wall biosynthesis